MTDNDVIAYKYRVVPKNPDWHDSDKPAFEPHYSITPEHPEERFEGMDGVKAEDVTELVEASTEHSDWEFPLNND